MCDSRGLNVLATKQAKQRVTFENILLATDFLPAANAAVLYAAGLARSFGASLYALHVTEPTNYALPPRMWAGMQTAVEAEKPSSPGEKALHAAPASSSGFLPHHSVTLSVSGCWLSPSASLARCAAIAHLSWGTWHHKVNHEDIRKIVDSFRLQRLQEFLPRRRNQRLRGRVPECASNHRSLLDVRFDDGNHIRYNSWRVK
jgi:hypothetical protein